MDLKNINWDNSKAFKNFADPQIQMDMDDIQSNIEKIEKALQNFDESLETSRHLLRTKLDTDILLSTLQQYASMATSVNTSHSDAKDLLSKTRALRANLAKAFKPLDVFLMRAPDAFIEEFFESKEVYELRFLTLYKRKQRDFLLSVPEEVLLEGHAVDGLHGWGQLYTDLAGSLKVDVGGEIMGLADASNLLKQGDREMRAQAFRGINQAWQENEVSAGAILNAINGWRIENNRTRSKIRTRHYLDQSCHDQRLERATLNSLIDTAFERRSVGHKAIQLMAKEMSLNKLAPYDLMAPFPAKGSERVIPLPQAIEVISTAFRAFDPEMADFAEHMFKEKWIDSAKSENRSTGAYCTGLTKLREPRVFITYDGSLSNLITLAHEIGHAYHSWVMRDLPLGETSYSMPLAETASIFAETLVRSALLDQAENESERKSILWQELESAAALLINIPARFDFERSLVEARMLKSLTPKEIKELNLSAWKKWYGDSLEFYDEMFWASKLHFSISSFGFYNYTYLFGYLFSLNLYGRREQYGNGFKEAYVELLRDTGRMTAEELVKKHLGEDLTLPQFWQDAISTVESLVHQFEGSRP